jgi:hypothetical protein
VEHKNKQGLEAIRDFFCFNSFSMETELARLEKRQGDIQAQFRQQYHPGESSKARLLQLQNDDIYTAWQNSQVSRILVLAGRNQVTQAAYCWLSPMVFDLITKITAATPKDPYSFYVVGETEEDTFPRILFSIIYRLLSQHHEVLKDPSAYDKFLTAFGDYRKAITSNAVRKKQEELLISCAFEALNMFRSFKTVWVVLDRLDQCAPKPPNYHRKALLKALVKLAENQELKVKFRVLVVVNAIDWDVEEQADIERAEHGTIVIQTLWQDERMR